VTARVKICGLSTPETMEAALEAGADYVGLVFFPRSPRHVEMAAARELAMMASGTADVVALLVDPDDALVGRIAAELGPDIIQLHGKETPERVLAIGEMAATRTMKAVAVADRADAERALDYKAAADLILFDAKPPKDAVLPGGNGLAFDWTAIADVASQVDYMLSGGLTPDNVAEAIAVTGARAVDVSSGVESAPGVKDADLIRSFIAAAHSAAGS
jgi:phosphoribosylanthranilate isomerase